MRSYVVNTCSIKKHQQRSLYCIPLHQYRRHRTPVEIKGSNIRVPSRPPTPIAYYKQDPSPLFLRLGRFHQYVLVSDFSSLCLVANPLSLSVYENGLCSSFGCVFVLGFLEGAANSCRMGSLFWYGLWQISISKIALHNGRRSGAPQL